MRVFTFLFFILSFSATARDADSSAVSNETSREDQIVVDLTWDRLLGADGIEQKWFSRGVNIYGMYDLPFNKAGNASFGIGGGFSSQNYFTNGIVYRFDSNNVNYSDFFTVPDSTFQKNKLSLNYVDVPFEFRFRTKENKNGNRWKLAFGGKVGYLVNVHDKFINNKGVKFKTYDFPNVNRLRYGVTARVGYGSVMLSAFYGLSTLFDENNSVEAITPLSIGISIVPF